MAELISAQRSSLCHPERASSESKDPGYHARSQNRGPSPFGQGQGDNSLTLAQDDKRRGRSLGIETRWSALFTSTIPACSFWSASLESFFMT